MSYRSVFRPDLFQGQIHIVTGGGSGIGAAAAVRFLADGAAVCIADLRAEALAAQVEEKVA